MKRGVLALLLLGLFTRQGIGEGLLPACPPEGDSRVTPDRVAPPRGPGLLCGEPCGEGPYRKGACSVQVLAGYFPANGWGPEGPCVDYAPVSVRAGVVLSAPAFDRGVCPGAFEALVDYTHSVIIREFGSYFTGPSLLLRYTHCSPRWLVHPYAQVGAGLAFTDAHRSAVWQELVGQSCEFLLRAEVGARVRLTGSLSFDVEGGFQHISNAGIAPRNGGINNVGFAIGLTYSFGGPERSAGGVNPRGP